MSEVSALLSRGSWPMPEFVQIDGLKRYFDVSAPWLVRKLENRPRQIVQAVDGVDITIAKGETFSLVGESGCGKSTVARLVVGLNPPWRVFDIIAEPIRAFGLAKDKADLRQQVEDLLRQVRLTPADGAKFPHEFSGGQRQRVSIARALASRPEFLVCDEPTSALDVSVQAQILNLMMDLQRRL